VVFFSVSLTESPTARKKKAKSLKEKEAVTEPPAKTPSEEEKTPTLPANRVCSKKAKFRKQEQTSVLLECLILQPVQEIRSKVRNDNTRASTKNTLCSLESHSFEIEHSSLCSSADHGVFTTDLVCSNRQVLANLFCVTDNVEVLRGGLDHNDIGSFIDVAYDCSAGETAAAGGKLVASKRWRISILGCRKSSKGYLTFCRRMRVSCQQHHGRDRTDSH
jgi:hypothetical protein